MASFGRPMRPFELEGLPGRGWAKGVHSRASELMPGRTASYTAVSIGDIRGRGSVCFMQQRERNEPLAPNSFH